jgi:D-amino-acid dehydrogenase
MHVCVLGAGIVGLATAYRLNREGHEVTVIDRAAPGAGASGGNGAQLSYSYVQPLADPAIWRQLPGLLLSPTSPLKLRPRLDPHQWRWGLAFLGACNARTSRDTTGRLLRLAAVSRVAFEQMLVDVQPACDFSATGKLVLYASTASLEAARRQLDLQRQLGGGEQRLVTPQQCVDIEPALEGYHRQIAGGIHTPSECAADCLKVCEALVRVLRERGVRILEGTCVTSLAVHRGAVAAVNTAQGPVPADQVVLALGSGSHALARPLGVDLPVYPIKGYSITLDVAPGLDAAPRVSVTDSARKVVFARIGARLRVAGMAELVGHDDAIPDSRIGTLKAAAQALFPRCGDFRDLHPWTGMRPATPTGVPIVGRLRGAPPNLLFNTGHGALGFTLAFGSAQRIVQALANPAAA